MKTVVFAVFASFAILQVEALLPPLYQTSSAIKAILTDEQLGQKLQSGEMILKIEKNEQGYEVTTNHHRLQVDVGYEPAQRPGPAQFKLHFGEPLPLSN